MKRFFQVLTVVAVAVMTTAACRNAASAPVTETEQPATEQPAVTETEAPAANADTTQLSEQTPNQ